MLLGNTKLMKITHLILVAKVKCFEYSFSTLKSMYFSYSFDSSNSCYDYPSTGIIVAAILSQNQNFEGCAQPLTRANYLASPPLVAYALPGMVCTQYLVAVLLFS